MQSAGGGRRRLFPRHKTHRFAAMGTSHSPLQVLFSVIFTTGVIGCFVWLYVRALRKRPRFEPSDVVFQERFASGCSQKNVLTKLGGARNCLRLVVTRRFLWVTSWFPFSLIAPFYDLEHVIPLDSILSLRRSTFLGRRTLL